jgi:hypothetical protein
MSIANNDGGSTNQILPYFTTFVGEGINASSIGVQPPNHNANGFSIDRIDNNLCHIMDNCQIICRRCQSRKR